MNTNNQMEQMETNSEDFEQEDPEIFDKDLYKLQHELSCLKVKTQVSKMFLEEQKKYLQELQKELENNDNNSAEDSEMENSLLMMQNTFQKLYEERLKIVNTSESRDNLAALVQSIESSYHIRENEFEKHIQSFELICEKQENSEELQELNQLQTNLDAETKKLDFLLVEKDQLDKEVAEKEKLEMKELQKKIIELATFAVQSKKHEEQEEKENVMIKRLEKELSMLEAKEKALIDHEEEYLNDNVIQVELCQNIIPHFESIFKDPNDFPYLSSLTKIDDEKISSNENTPTIFKETLVEKVPIEDKRSEVKSNEKPQKESNKLVRNGKKSPSGRSKTSDKITKQSSPVKKSYITSILKSPKKSKIAPRKQEVSLIDKLPSKKNRRRSVAEAQEQIISISIENAMLEDKKVDVQESPKQSRKRSVAFDSPIDNATPHVQDPVQESPKSKRKPLTVLSPKDSIALPVTILKPSSPKDSIYSPVTTKKPVIIPKASMESPITTKKPMITSTPKASMESPITTKKPVVTSTPRVTMDSPFTSKKPMVTSTPKASMDTPLTSKKSMTTSSLRATVPSPTNKTKIISVEILPHIRFGTDIRSQANLINSKPRILSQEVIKESSEKSSVTVDKKNTPEVIVESPKEIIWKSPQVKSNKKQTLIADRTPNISDNCSETSDMANLFNDDFDNVSVTSGAGSEIDFLSPNSTKSFKMDTSENDNAKGSKKTAFDFDSFSDSTDFAGGSLF